MGHKLSDTIVEFLNEIAIENGFKNFEIRKSNTENKGDGFASVIVPVEIIDGEKVLELIVKMGPKNAEIRKSIPFERVFIREGFIYNSVLPHFKSLQEKYKIQPCEIFENYPKCYKVFLKFLEEVLIMENLSAGEKYSVWDKSKIMDFPVIEMVFRKYAKLHALSFATRHLNPEKFQEISKNTKDVYLEIIKSCGTADVLRNLVKKVVKYLEVNDEKEILEKLTADQFDIIDVMEELVESKEAGDYAVLCHGDNWANNLMFQYKDVDPIDVKFIDWQLARFGSPVLDLSYFLYACGGPNSFNKLDQLLISYHQAFRQFLTHFDLDGSEVFPLETLRAHWRKFSRFGLGMSFMVVHVSVKAKEETPNVDQDQTSEDFLKTFQNSSRNDDDYIKRMTDILKHFVNNNFI